MSHILAEWINKTVQLSTPVESDQLDFVFRSGYLFGELLQKLDVQDHPSKNFIDAAHVDALIRNYTSLETILDAKLGIKLTPNYAMDMIHGKYGAAAKLLYQIKSGVAKMPLKDKFSKLKSKNRDDLSYPSTPVAGRSPEKVKLEESPKHVYKEKEHAFFATMLKAKLKRYDPILSGNPPLPEKDSASPATIAAAREPISIKQSPKVKKLAPIVKKGRSVLTNEPQEKKLPDSKKQAALEAKLKEIERKRLEVTDTISRDINVFESRLNPGAETDQIDDLTLEQQEEAEFDKALEADIIADFVKTRAGINHVQHIKILSHMVPASDQKEQANKKYLDKLRAQRTEEEYSRRDREQRRRKIILSHQQAQQDLEKKHIEDLVMSKLLRQSKQERRIAEQLLQVRHEKEVMHENRVFREQQYSERRQKDYEDALAREFEKAEKARQEYKEQTALQLKQHQEILAAKAHAKHIKNTSFVETLVNQIIDLSFKLAEYRSLNDKKDAPARKVREWKTLFIKGAPVTNPTTVALEKDSIVKTQGQGDQDGDLSLAVPSDQDSDAVQILDEKEFEDYIESQGSWEFPEKEQAIIRNNMLGVLVEDVINLTSVQEASYELTPLPSAPLKLAVIGKKFSGKSNVAQFLAEKYNMSVLTVEDLVKDAINQADISAKKQDKKDDKSNKKTLSKAQIGAKLQLAMMEGQSPDDSLLVSLFIEVLSQEPTKSGGWILVDFPRTRAQAALLERELSGYEDPKPVKKGDLKRTKEKEKAPGKIKSMIASNDSGTESSGPPPISGLDCVLMMEIDNETAIARSAGQRMDPITGKIYHLETNPPPKDEPGLFERLVPLEDEGKSRTQLQYHLASFEEEDEPIREWINRFKILKIVDGSKLPQKSCETAYHVVREVVELKEAEKRQREATSPKTDETLKDEEKPIEKPPSRPGVPVSKSRAGTPNDLARIKTPGSKEGKRQNTPLSGDILATVGEAAANELLETLSHHVSRVNSADGRKLPSKELAEVLMDQWKTIESTYTASLKFSFRSLRREREAILNYFHDVKVNFKKFLERPDTKQELVDLFQTEFNAIEDDLRYDVDAKAELHQRVEDLRDKLWEMSDKKRDEAESERISIIEDKWIEDHSNILANIYITMLQAEVDRFYSTRQFVLDYYKDANGTPLGDPLKLNIKVPMCSISGNAPVEIGNVLISAHEQQASQRREGAQPTQQAAPVAPAAAKAGVKGAPATPSTKDKKGATAAAAPKPATTNDAPVSRHADRHYPTEHVAVDYENVQFPDLQAAVDFILSNLSPTDHTADAQGKDKKKNPAGGFEESKPESDPLEGALLPDYQKTLDYEEIILKKRIERIRLQAVEHLKELRNKGYEVYFQLDDWIGSRFQAEMDAARDMSNVIKEAIESEAKLPNQLILDGEKFQVDFGSLMLVPEVEPRPESPVEKLSSDRFTVLQLVNLSRQFKLIAPSGVISTKAFLDSLTKTAALSQSTDLLPENYSLADAQQFQNICSILDPFQTGFLSWRKFLLINSKILPAPLESIVELSAQYQKSPSFRTGRISRDEFFQTPLWFEAQDDADLESNGGFDRKRKLKEAIFQFFATSPDPTASSHEVDTVVTQGDEITLNTPSADTLPAKTYSTPAVQPVNILKEHEIIPDDGSSFDVMDFLFCCCADDTASQGVNKAFHILGTAEGLCDAQRVNAILHHFLLVTETSHRLEREEAIDDPYPMESIQNVFVEAGVGKDGWLSFAQFSNAADKVGLAHVAHPLFQLEELAVTGGRSRPSSGAAAADVSKK